MEHNQGNSKSAEHNSLSDSASTQREIVSPRSIEDMPPPVRKDRCAISKRKICIVAGISILLAALIIILAVVLTRKENSHINGYQETKYVLKVNSTISSKLGSQKSSNHDEIDLTLFALDMKGDKYSLMIVNGIFRKDIGNTDLEDAPVDIFMSFDLSRSGEILETRYVMDKLTNETTNSLTGIIHAFVVDQDSEYDEESKCKRIKKDSSQCTRNSKHKDGNMNIYRKSAKKEAAGADYEKLEHITHTWVNQHGKVEKSTIEGKIIISPYNVSD